MKRNFTLLAVFLLLALTSIRAQINTPPGAATNGPVPAVDDGGRGYNLYWNFDHIIAEPFARGSWGNTVISFPDKVLSVKPKKGRKGILLVLMPRGIVHEIYFYGHSSHIIKIDTIGVGLPTGSWTDYQGDAYYALGGGLVVFSRDSGATFQLDTTGLLYPSAIYVDSAQNVYALASGGLYFQTATGSTWSKVSAFPATSGNFLFIDRRNRIWVASGNTVYASSTNGASWTSGTLPTSAGTFGDDAFGNIYTSAGSRSYRSTDGGATWTRIDQPITSYAMDTMLYPIINGIQGDTAIFAATAWGIFMSSDQGTIWTLDNRGVQSAPNGYWLFNNGRQVANTDLGTFIKNATDSDWTQTYPTGGKYLKMGLIQGDTMGNIYTVMSLNSGQVQMPMKSTDQGATWQPDTAGLASVMRASLYAYYIDEYGGSHIAGYDSTGFNSGVYLLYSKTATGSYSLDTAGFGAQMPNFANILTYCSDHSGYLYMSGHNNAGVSIWRRPVTGGTWQPDTAGIGRGYLTLSAYDHNSGVIGLNWVSNALYHRDVTGWKNMHYPNTVYSFSTPAGITGNPGGGLISSFQLYSFTNNSYNYYGMYCTHDAGATWSYIPGLDSTGVNSAETFGDTTYILTSAGIYKMTCNGVVINPSGIAVVNDEEDLRLYPNPTSGLCHLEINKAVKEGGYITVQDLTGRAVRTISITANETTFRTDDMNAGMYICTIISDGRAIGVKRLMVE